MKVLKCKKPVAILNILFCVFICAILAWYAVANAEQFKAIVSNQKNISLETWQSTAATIESQFKEKVIGRNQLINLYGISLRVFHKNLVGNFEFLRDGGGIMQRFEERAQPEKFVSSMLDLKERLDRDGIPLVFLQFPDRTNIVPLAAQLDFTAQTNEVMLDSLHSGGIDILNLEELMNQDNSAPMRSEVFFHTDGHFATEGEFWMTKCAVEYLMEKYQVEFAEFDSVFDIARYDIHSYDFLGSHVRSVGKYFVGMDSFNAYIPKFETDMVLVDKERTQTRNGSFETVAMNGYEQRNNITPYTYWVINYGHYPEPYYEYRNNLNPSGPKLLVIADSSLLRGAAFLSLACSKVTVVDIRSIKEIPYVEQALNEELYDAVIVGGFSRAFLSSAFKVNTIIPDLPERPAQTADYWIGTNGIGIETYNGTTVKNAGEITLDTGSSMVTLVGWAADFNELKPLDALYLQIGDISIQCSYGIEKPAVVKHFQSDSLKNTGFSVSFPTSYLSNEQKTELQFIQIGSDGTYCYEPVTYYLLNP